MPNRPYLTSAEAATYCGFKTIGGIQQAVRRGKLKPAGRRGGTGTYVFATEDLDLFLTGGLPPGERLFVAPPNSPGAEPPARSEPPALPASAPRRRKPPTDADPVTRIIRALSAGSPEAEKKAQRATRVQVPR